MSIRDQIQEEIQETIFQQAYSNDGQRFLAWYLCRIHGLNHYQARDCITDGPNDKQIDAIFVDDEAATVYILQGKFFCADTVGAGPLEEVLKSWVEIKDLNRLQSNANEKLASKINELSVALQDGYDVRLQLITTASLSDQARADLETYQQELNRDESLSAVIEAIDGELLEAKYEETLNHPRPYIDHEIPLESGKYMEMTIGGTKAIVAVLSIAECVRIPGIKDGTLFRKNVRQSLGNTNKVNKGIARTLRTNPQDFFFLHNGITAICSSMSVHDDILTVKELNVVNGCQSLNTIFNNSEAARRAEDAYILFRFYEIGDAERGDRISTSTNSQTAVKARDLRSNDKAVLKLKRDYEQRYPGSVFITKRGEAVDRTRYAADKVVYLTEFGKELIAWHSQRPTIAYSETKVFDVYFDQLFHHDTDYKPVDVQALAELHRAVLPYWEPDNEQSLDPELLAIKAYGPYHQMYAISMIATAVNKVAELVPTPSLTLARLKESGQLDTVVQLAGQCINAAYNTEKEALAGEGKSINIQNWSKNKSCLRQINAQIRFSLTPNVLFGQAQKELIKRLQDGLAMSNESFTQRWTAD